MIIETAAALLVLAMAAAGGAIARNGVPLLGAPGPGRRLLIYLNRNSATTSSRHSLPELRTRRYALGGDELLDRVHRVISGFGWQIAGMDTAGGRLHAVATTPWLRFKDDVRICIEPASGGGSTLNVASQSRIGRADYGANISHVMALYGALEANF